MLLIFIRNVALLAGGVVVTSGLTIPTEGSLSDTPAPLIKIPLPLDTDPPSPSNDLEIQCRGSQYGTNLRYDSCLDAFRTFTHGAATNPVHIGRRRDLGYTIGLPWKWVSGKGTNPTRAIWSPSG